MDAFDDSVIRLMMVFSRSRPSVLIGTRPLQLLDVALSLHDETKFVSMRNVNTGLNDE